MISTFSFIPIGMGADSYCGDGILNEDLGEECDDYNFINRDGCSAYCMIEDMTPPEVTEVSIAENAENIQTITDEITVTFSEKVDPKSINKTNIQFKQFLTEFPIDFDLHEDGKTLTVSIDDDLVGNEKHSLIINNIKDLVGNRMSELYVRSFTTGDYLDHTAPTIVPKPAAGTYNYPQSIILTPYIDEYTGSDENIDLGAKIYYTIDGSRPSTTSPLFSTSITIDKNGILQYFGVDEKGNSTAIMSQEYKFECAEKLNSIKVSPYPTCQIQECNYGYKLIENVCVVDQNAADDFKANAATAPLFGSETPMTISTKPALYITSEHKGIIPRPIIFKDLVRGTVIEFERDTKISRKDGRAFAGYILPPVNLYSKDFPIHFGYTFKWIFKFQSEMDEDLTFSPAYKITIPFSDRFDEGVPVVVFSYDPKTEKFTEYTKSLVTVNENQRTVTIISDKNDSFFVAQEGRNYNKTVFTDVVNHWAHNYIEELYRMDIVKGRDQGIFAPDDYLTRAEFIKIALKSIGEEIDLNQEVKKAPFEDVPIYAWYSAYIKRAKEIGLIHGYPDGTFKPDQPIIKVEAIKILMNAFGFDVEDVGKRTDNFRDLETDQWYYPAVHYAIEKGLVDGRRLKSGVIVNFAFDPASNITRAEMAKMAIKTIEFKEEIDSK
ncbi:S-layer homology domain-containing protein [Candidatus Peregrinibacteria bacterium]|nr:S-layer homology domain-containing protein [Candidatus Peregrinibacteria bacterium]